MNNVSIKGVCECADLDRKINLQNGSIVIQKEKDQVIGAYMVVSFRDHKGRYGNGNTASYCHLIDMDSGQLAFEEHCSRATTERRLLRHLTHAGFTMPYDPNSRDQDHKFANMRIQVYTVGNYKMELDLLEEQIIGGKR